MALGVRYGVGASHWRIDTIGTNEGDGDTDSLIRELFRQQLWIAQDERVTIFGHPWYHGKAPWFEDFSIIPRSMNEELAAALKENGKCVECNTGVMLKFEEKARYQYAEFLREMLERGLRITFGSDSHGAYNDNRMGTGRGDLLIEKYLLAAGFKDGDFYTLQDSDLW
jgi:histidinol phosphatase-like PHP family hydrolase